MQTKLNSRIAIVTTSRLSLDTTVCVYERCNVFIHEHEHEFIQPQQQQSR